MACAWKETMKAADLPDVVIKAILEAGYERDEIFSGAFCNIDAFEKWLVKLRAKLGEPHAHMDPEDWGTSPTAAKIRIFWRKLSANCPRLVAGRQSLARGWHLACQLFHSIRPPAPSCPQPTATSCVALWNPSIPLQW